MKFVKVNGNCSKKHAAGFRLNSDVKSGFDFWNNLKSIWKNVPIVNKFL